MNMTINQTRIAADTVQEQTSTIPTFDAKAMVGKDRICRISLDGTPYVLRITKANKLILTK